MRKNGPLYVIELQGAPQKILAVGFVAAKRLASKSFKDEDPSAEIRIYEDHGGNTPYLAASRKVGARRWRDDPSA